MIITASKEVKNFKKWNKLILLDGKKLANKITKQIRDRSIDITRSFGFKPGLVVILVGENSASEVYVRNKRLVAEKVGFESYERKLDLREIFFEC